MPSSRFARFLLAWCLVCLAGLNVAARAQLKATASLADNPISPGDATTLTIEITGAQQLNPPASVDVAGLIIAFRGHQQHMRVINGQVSRSISLAYTVEARTAGSFVIPAIPIQTDAGIVKTEPLMLTVQAPAPGTKRAEGDDVMVFAEINVSKKSVFLGESVPVEVRFYADRRIRARIEQMPVLEGEGFTKAKFPNPRMELARKNGREFEVTTLRTTIAPAKAGKVKLGPMEIPYLASIPRAKRSKPRSPLDLLDNSFFDDPFGTFTPTERRKVTAAAIELEVKPLPAAGRPADFSGAVGKFQMTVEGSPAKVKVGDPVTLRMRISGAGNFDRVNAPTLVEPSGWHPYEPSSDFKATDELSASGTKSFEMAVVPEEKKTQMPQVQFSYFDPDTEKYVTLKSEPAALLVEGGAPPPPPAPAAAPAPSAGEPPAATPAPLADILGLKYETGSGRKTFTPIYRSRVFLIAQGVPLLGLIVLLAARFLRKDEAARRVAALRRERAELWRRLRGGKEHTKFFESAARLVQIETALATGRPDASVDAEVARSSRPLDEETAAGIDEIFNSRGELAFAGVAGGNGSLSSNKRERVLATLEHFSRSHGKN